MTFSTKAFRSVMSCFATGVTIVTTKHHHEYYGLTVNSFASVSLDPFLILINIEKRSFTHEKILHSQSFAVNILTGKQKELSKRFARIEEINKFTGLDLFETRTGAPIIQGSFAYLDAHVQKIIDGGDHSMFLGEVIDIGILNEHATPLLYFRGNYTQLRETIEDE